MLELRLTTIGPRAGRLHSALTWRRGALAPIPRALP